MLVSIGILYLLHIIQMAIEMKGWAEGNLTLLINTAVISAQTFNAVMLVLSTKWYWYQADMLRRVMWIISCVQMGFYLFFLIDVIVVIASGRAIMNDIMSMFSGFILFFQTPGFLIAVATFVLELVTNDLNPYNENWFSHPDWNKKNHHPESVPDTNHTIDTRTRDYAKEIELAFI